MQMGVKEEQFKDYGTAMDIGDNVLGIDVIIDAHIYGTEPAATGLGFTTPITGMDTADMIGVIKFYSENGVITPEMSIISREDATIADIAPDKDVTDILDKATAELAEFSDKIVAKSPASYDYDKSYIRNNEMPIGNLVSDAMKWASNADIVFCNSGNIRAVLGEGDVTNGHIVSLLPYTNAVIKADVPGSVIREALSHSADFYGMDNGGFMQVGGLSYTFDVSKPTGERILEITAGGEALDDNKIYSLATFDFIADGGDGYTMLTEYFQGKSEGCGIVTEIFEEYLNENDSFVMGLDNRIIIKNAPNSPAEASESSVVPWIIAGIAVVVVAAAVVVVLVIVKRKRSK
jgi:2',3'-cyclic-nucleotide 2'-phosphodiesterase (5'-nucleotidase family)